MHRLLWCCCDVVVLSVRGEEGCHLWATVYFVSAEVCNAWLTMLQCKETATAATTVMSHATTSAVVTSDVQYYIAINKIINSYVYIRYSKLAQCGLVTG